MSDTMVAVIGGFLSAYGGVLLSARINQAQARKQKAEADAATREAYLRHLQDEFLANRRLMKEIATYVEGGPVIDEVLAPAEIASMHLRFTAWDALVRAGVLASLDPADQHLFRVADGAARRAAQDVQTIAAIWRRGLAWDRWNEKEAQTSRLVQRMPMRESLWQLQRQITHSVTEASERTDQALARLKVLLPDDAAMSAIKK